MVLPPSMYSISTPLTAPVPDANATVYSASSSDPFFSASIVPLIKPFPPSIVSWDSTFLSCSSTYNFQKYQRGTFGPTSTGATPSPSDLVIPPWSLRERPCLPCYLRTSSSRQWFPFMLWYTCLWKTYQEWFYWIASNLQWNTYIFHCMRWQCQAMYHLSVYHPLSTS